MGLGVVLTLLGVAFAFDAITLGSSMVDAVVGTILVAAGLLAIVRSHVPPPWHRHVHVQRSSDRSVR
ncbi:hypothetical protein [Nocardioides antri]|uniref:Uncharacterized protein n=1 Tax=Nocardioides antri TaxID=2607659 RepID=A0A5B1M5C0_9ACTN|nr:hypothetical protein [Nocardioides antri]KAA1428475.1 hypothetical protein F0U47_06050 [Nocardioides antri]